MERFETNPTNLNALMNNPREFIMSVEFEKERIKKLLYRTSNLDVEELKRRAFSIKPLVRVVDGRIAPLGTFPPEPKVDNSSRLVYINPFDIRQSYRYQFSKDCIVLNDDGDELQAWDVEEVGRFICYHRYGEYWQFLRPSADEVLEQIPEEFLEQGVNAFEICFVSNAVDSVLFPSINRHISIVILYRRKGGLPEEVKYQHIVIDGKIF